MGKKARAQVYVRSVSEFSKRHTRSFEGFATEQGMMADDGVLVARPPPSGLPAADCANSAAARVGDFQIATSC